MAYDILKGSSGTPLVFLMVESADHITGLTGATCTVTISKNGGAFGSPSGSVTEIANGWYQVAGNATDTGTAGPLVLHATAASGDPTDIVVANIIDPAVAVYGGNLVNIAGSAVSTSSAQLGVNVVNFGGTGVTGRDIGASVLLSSGTGTGQISLSSGAVLLQATQTGVTIPTVTTVTNQLTAAAIATGVWTDTTAGDFTTALSIGKSVMNGVSLGTGLTINGYTGNTPQTGDVFAQLPTHFSSMAIDASGNVSLSAAELNSIADALLNRDMAAGTDTNTHSPRNALRFLRNTWSISGTTLTVTKEDQVTSAWTATVGTTPGVNPITSNTAT